MREFSSKGHVFKKLAKLRCTKRRAGLSIPPKPIPILEPISIPVGKCSGKPRAIRFVTDTLCGSRNKAGFQEKCYIPLPDRGCRHCIGSSAKCHAEEDRRRQNSFSGFHFSLRQKIVVGDPCCTNRFHRLSSIHLVDPSGPAKQTNKLLFGQSHGASPFSQQCLLKIS